MPLELGLREHRRPLCDTAQKAQAGPTLSFRRGLLWVPGSPKSPGPNPGVSAQESRTPSLSAVPLPSGPSSCAVPTAGVARGPHRQGRKARPPPLPSLRPSTTCRGLGDPPPLALHAPPSSARDAGALGLFPLPPGPLSDHVTLLQSPCPNFRTPSERCAVQPFRRKSEPGDRLGIC